MTTTSSSSAFKRSIAGTGIRAAVAGVMALYAISSQAVSPVTQFEYDANGNRTKITDPLNRPTVENYDALNRLKQATDAASGITQYGYDNLSRLTSVIDPRNLTTSYTYNAFGDLLSLASPDTGTTQNTYDAAGNLLTKTDAKGQITTYSYDVLNRITQIQYADGQVTNYAYDQGTNANGRLTGISHVYPTGHAFVGTLTLQFTYDARGRMLTESRTLPSGNSATLAYGYDSAGRLSSMTYPSGRTVTYQYDPNGRVASVTTAESGGAAQTILTDMSYRPFGMAKSQLWGNAVQHTKSFDAENRLTGFQIGSNQVDLGYDAASNIISRLTTPISGSPSSESFSYDNLDRLTQHAQPSVTNSWAYDAVGNRTSQTTGAGSTNYQYGTTSNRLTQINSQTIISDANGAITNDGSGSFTYDARGRLSAATNTAGTTSYLIDPLGRRLAKSGPLGTTQFVYDSAGHLVAELSATGTTSQEHLWANETPVAVNIAQTTSGTPVVLDNVVGTSFSTLGAWVNSTSIPGYQGANYQYHVPTDGPVGSVVDSLDTGFNTTGSWTASSAVSGYQGSNYLYRLGTGDPVNTSILDNTDSTATAVGTWTTSAGVAGYQGSNYVYSPAGTGANQFTWSAPLTAGEYKVYAKWTAHANRASNAQYTVTHQSGQSTVTVNQQQNTGWNLLGTYTFDTSGIVSLSDQANGYVVADAVKFVPTAGSLPTATWSAPLTAGQYKVYAKWTAHTNRASDAQYTITHQAGQDTVTVNQQQSTGWNLLGTYTFDGNGTVSLSDQGNGHVIADAVRFVNVNAVADVATWVPATAGTYEVYANWTAYPNRATDAKYIITHQGGQSTVIVDQTQSGSTWNSLGSYQLNPASGHKIQLSSEANNHVIADAIKLVPTGTAAQLLYVHSDQLGTPRALTNTQNQTIWSWEGEAFGNTPANADPDQNGQSVTYNLRFPGQYYDQESNNHYNYFRDYNPATGRYIESDPIGLEGGINTYAYVEGNPLSSIDSKGLSTLEFKRKNGTIYAYDEHGELKFSCPAGNNLTNKAKKNWENGNWTNGTYGYSHYNLHEESRSDGPYGSYGIHVFTVEDHSGVGVHSGRKGPDSVTEGCVRTTDPCMKLINELHLTDPLIGITIREE